MSSTFVLNYPGGKLSLHRCRIMGILNITPDSFSDGGRFLEVEDAVARAWEIMDQGADILDIGAESSRPGASPLDGDAEIARLAPIVKALFKQNYPIPISLDSYKPEVLKHFVDKGHVQICNDITGLRNPQMVEVIKAAGIPVVLMHMFGNPQTMQDDFVYQDIIEDLLTFFKDTLGKYTLNDNVVIDPGIGFGKGVAHNLRIIRELEVFHQLNLPLLLGASRKSFIGKTLNLKVDQRLEPSLAAAALAVDKGCQILRVHDVKETRAVVNMVEAINHSSNP